MQDVIGLLLVDQDGNVLRSTMPEVSYQLPAFAAQTYKLADDY